MAALSGHASVVPLLLADPRVEATAKDNVRSSHDPMMHIVWYDPYNEGCSLLVVWRALVVMLWAHIFLVESMDVPYLLRGNARSNAS